MMDRCATCQNLVVYDYKAFSKIEARFVWERETALIAGDHPGGDILKYNK